eukprot:2943457-Rhodomonas_salina.2
MSAPDITQEKGGLTKGVWTFGRDLGDGVVGEVVGEAGCLLGLRVLLRLQEVRAPAGTSGARARARDWVERG